MELRIGILIIGSLYWDRGGGRQLWRERRLNAAGEFSVTAPVRYGRVSKKRHNTYTMVLFKSDRFTMGTAKVVECSHRVTSVCDLLTEAEWLWAAESEKAEQRADSEDRRCIITRDISASWGCVALLPNPSRKVPQSLLAGWSEHVSHRNYRHNPRRLVTEQGLLGIDWPTLTEVDQQLPVDLLLATSNEPERNYPDPQTIAEAWNRQPQEAAYFFCNNESGITTFQDRDIRAQLQIRWPPIVQ